METAAGAPAIELDGLTKRFGAVHALDHVSLRVEPGEVCGFLGPNGAGKTTAIKILLDLIRPTDGCARILGLDTRHDSLAVRRQVGYVPGDIHFPRDMNGEEFLDFVTALRPQGADPALRRALVARLEVDLSRPLTAMSTGQRQKVALVQALMSRSAVLILDEPTSGLDPIVRREVLALLHEQAREGVTIFLSSHVLAEVQTACSRVAILRRGQLLDTLDVRADTRLLQRRVRIRFAAPPPDDLFTGIDGITLRDRAQEPEGVTWHLDVRGDFDRLIATLATCRVADLEITPPTLEELVLSYYRGETGAPGAFPTGERSSDERPGDENEALHAAT